MRAFGAIRNNLWFLFIALLIRGVVLLLTPNALAADTDGYRRLAENLVTHGTFGAGDVPTAFRSPLYPLLLTGWVALGEYGRVAVGVLHVALGVATVGLVLLLGRWWGLPRRAAVLAALLVACDPILLVSSTQLMTETLAVFLATVGLVALTLLGQRSYGRQESAAKGCGSANAAATWLAALAGAVLALGALCRPASLLWAIAAGVVLCVRNSRGLIAPGRVFNNLRIPLAFFLGFLLVLGPWAIRNQLQFGRPIVTTTHGGYTLLLANNPEFYEWLRAGPWGSVWWSDRFDAEWDHRKPQGELASDRAAYAEARQTIRREPGTFVYSCFVRLGRFWSPLPHQIAADESPLRRLSRWAVAAWYVAEFFLAAIGGVWCLRRNGAEEREEARFPPFTWLWGMLLIFCLSAAHTVYWTDMRMRAPVMPVVALAAAAGVLRLRQGVGKQVML